MTERQRLPGLDTAQAAVEASREAFIEAFTAVVIDARTEQHVGTLQMQLRMLLHRMTNLFYSSTVKTVDYATAARNTMVSELKEVVKAMGERQERHADWLTKHDTRLVDLTQRITHIEQALELYEQADACRTRTDQPR
ncbi:MAG TPA: hypothetical protein VFT66_15745 [Roseiflexaceae bacterium]|nr:hypothetical protein [Roseiflexaceae bacterium]